MTHRIIDFHTHAFPDALARRAMKTLLDEAPGIKAYLDGTTGALLHSMDRAGIATSVVCCIATKPEQFDPIRRWCHEIRSERLVPFPSIHPADPDCIAHIRQLKKEGFQGVKLHPFYQDFFAAEERMLGFYEIAAEQELLVVMHTGFDIAFPRVRRADPETLARIQDALPTLRLVTTHLGGWQQWDEVERHLLGREIYMEISFAIEDLGIERARRFIMAHPEGYVLFGTDSPWTDQAETMALVEKMDLPTDRLKGLFVDNAIRLLQMP